MFQCITWTKVCNRFQGSWNSCCTSSLSHACTLSWCIISWTTCTDNRSLVIPTDSIIRNHVDASHCTQWTSFETHLEGLASFHQALLLAIRLQRPASSNQVPQCQDRNADIRDNETLFENHIAKGHFCNSCWMHMQRRSLRINKLRFMLPNCSPNVAVCLGKCTHVSTWIQDNLNRRSAINHGSDLRKVIVVATNAPWRWITQSPVCIVVTVCQIIFTNLLATAGIRKLRLQPIHRQHTDRTTCRH